MQQVKIGKKKLQTANCEPTLNDTHVLEFCKQGYLVYEGVVPSEINRRVSEFIEKHGHAPLRHEDWFVENVLLNPTSGRCSTVASGRRLRSSGWSGKSSAAMSSTGAGMASGWRIKVWSRNQSFAGILLPTRHTSRTWSYRDSTGIPFPLLLAELDGTLR